MLTLTDYFARIGFEGNVDASLDTLRALHHCQPRAIAFENLSTVLNEPVRIDIDSVSDKLITRNRGGYCFEQNALLQAVLTEMGFDVTGLSARVVWSEANGHQNPRTHMVLLVVLDGQRWICDVGFGGATVTSPLKLDTDLPQATSHERVRLRREGHEYVAEVEWGSDFRSMYRFDLQPQLPIDFEALNHYVATHPRSHFRTTLFAGRVLENSRLALLNGTVAELQGGTTVSERQLVDGAALCLVLAEEFGIDMSSFRDPERQLQTFLAARSD